MGVIWGVAVALETAMFFAAPPRPGTLIPIFICWAFCAYRWWKADEDEG